MAYSGDVPEDLILLLGYVVFSGIIYAAICVLIHGSRSLALTSLVLAILPGFVFGRLRGLFWQLYGVMWFVALLLSLAAMIRAYWRRQTAPAKPRAPFMVISVLVGFAMLLFLCGGFPMFNHTPVDRSLERKIKPGMTKAEVEGILGPPSQRHRDTWSYYVGGWKATFLIDFDDEGNVYNAREWTGR